MLYCCTRSSNVLRLTSTIRNDQERDNDHVRAFWKCERKDQGRSKIIDYCTLRCVFWAIINFRIIYRFFLCFLNNINYGYQKMEKNINHRACIRIAKLQFSVQSLPSRWSWFNSNLKCSCINIPRRHCRHSRKNLVFKEKITLIEVYVAL